MGCKCFLVTGRFELGSTLGTSVQVYRVSLTRAWQVIEPILPQNAGELLDESEPYRIKHMMTNEYLTLGENGCLWATPGKFLKSSIYWMTTCFMSQSTSVRRVTINTETSAIGCVNFA